MSSYRLKDSLNRCTAKVMIAVGEKEGYKMRKSAELLHEILPESLLVVYPTYRHGDLSINHADVYAELFQTFSES